MRARIRFHYRSLLGALAVLALALPWQGAARAQVIRSYEALDQAAGDGWYTTLGLSLSLSGGNVEFVEVDASAALGYRGEKHFVRFYPAYRVRSQAGERIDDERAVHLRHSYIFGERLRSFAFVQYQSDLALQLQRRVLVGGGLRTRVVALAGGGIDLGLGVMREFERVTGEAARSDLRGANLVVVHGKAGTVELNFTGFYQPRLDHWSDVRLAGSGTAAVPLGSALHLTVATRWRRDTDPPPGVQEEDYGLSVGMRFSVR